ncbi:MAG: L-threonylcarbamoyladenylate synthase [Microscillaceae bacterium]|jgi:L-threonylcarbamoyladenylate synthase|nr:L-threonylcarbamoyladenylate synthase [Microscillaceae bacterium]
MDTLLQAKQLLEQGELVAIPTETVYGLAANALNSEAVAKIFQAKNRPNFDPLIVHTFEVGQVEKFVLDFPPILQKLAEKFWAGPLTLLLPKQALIPDLVTAGLDRVAVRIPRHPITLALLKMLDFPLAAPSANPFGYISPTTADHVRQQLGNKVKLILDGGASQVGIESTIVGFENEQVTVYRLGGISLEQIVQVVGKVHVKPHSSSNPNAPGMLENHYAPRKPLIINELNLNQFIQQGYWEFEKWGKINAEDMAAISFSQTMPLIPLAQQIVLSPTRQYAEAAQNLFAAMRSLDAMNIKIILAELLPEEDLGRAINDRLRRAAAK